MRPPQEDPGRLNLHGLEAGSHRPDVQGAIREAILLGLVRVRPMPGRPDQVRVFRADDPPEMAPP